VDKPPAHRASLWTAAKAVRDLPTATRIAAYGPTLAKQPFKKYSERSEQTQSTKNPIRAYYKIAKTAPCRLTQFVK
jgi:hypothetical protein